MVSLLDHAALDVGDWDATAHQVCGAASDPPEGVHEAVPVKKCQAGNTMATPTTSEPARPSCSCRAGGGRMMTAGMVNTGNASSTAVVSRPMLPSDRATGGPGSPARTSIVACTTPPVAPPPGSTRLAALPASWEVPATNQEVSGRVMRTSPHTATKLPASRRKSSTNHAGRIISSSGQAPSSDTRAGVTTYSPIAVTTRPAVRQPHLRRNCLITTAQQPWRMGRSPSSLRDRARRVRKPADQSERRCEHPDRSARRA